MKKLLIPVFAALVGCLAACRSHSVVELPRVSRDTLRIALERTDTLYVRDSVLLDRRADTVYHTLTRTVYRSKTLRDTVLHTVRDTVSVVVPAPAASTPRGFLIPWWTIPAALTLIALTRRRRE